MLLATLTNVSHKQSYVESRCLERLPTVHTITCHREPANELSDRNVSRFRKISVESARANMLPQVCRTLLENRQGILSKQWTGALQASTAFLAALNWSFLPQ